MAVLHAAGAPLRTSGYTLLIADDPTLVAAAQRLRHKVFATELGARLHPGAVGLDTDGFDAHCDHLIVREERTGEVVGTYRLLPPGRTERRYAADEFDLTALDPLRDDLVEAINVPVDLVAVGRSGSSPPSSRPRTPVAPAC